MLALPLFGVIFPCLQCRTTSGTMEPNIPVVLATAAEIAKALAYLHSKNILHIDLTGNNVLLTKANSDARGWMAKVRM
jgi:hypothetical protein